MYCSQQVVFERMKNLIKLFPRHIHILQKHIMSRDQQEKFSRNASFFGLILESSTLYKCYPVEVNTDDFPSLDYEYPVFIQGPFRQCVDANSLMLGVCDSANPYIWKNCTDVNNVIPKLQCEIFQAIFGPNWINTVTVTIEKKLVPEI